MTLVAVAAILAVSAAAASGFLSLRVKRGADSAGGFLAGYQSGYQNPGYSQNPGYGNPGYIAGYNPNLEYGRNFVDELKEKLGW